MQHTRTRSLRFSLTLIDTHTQTDPGEYKPSHVSIYMGRNNVALLLMNKEKTSFYVPFIHCFNTLFSTLAIRGQCFPVFVFFRLLMQTLELLEVSITISVMSQTSKQQNVMHMNLNY